MMQKCSFRSWIFRYEGCSFSSTCFLLSFVRFFFFLSKNMLKSLFNSCRTSQVRVNSLVCLGKILEYLDKWFVLDDILPFLQQIPSKEPAVLMGILGNYYFQLYPLLWFDIVSLKAFCIIVDKSSHSVSLKWLLKPFCFWFLSMPLFSYLMYYWYTFQALVHTVAVLSSDYSLLWHFHGLLFPQESISSVFF